MRGELVSQNLQPCAFHEAAAMLEAIRASADIVTVRDKALQLTEKLRASAE